jgi:hypothetical protein
MPGIDDLAPDQRAVLQLVLGQGRDFDQLAGLLKISPHAVRDRATAGTERLVPPPAGLNASERDAIVAYLLGAGSRPRDLSAPGREWGEDVREALRPLAKEPLPELPGGAPAAAAPTTPVASAAPRTTEPEAARPSERGPATAASSGEPRSRLGGALLLGGVALVVIVLVIVLIASGGSDDKGSGSSRAAATSTTATTGTAATNAANSQNGFKVETQVNLVSPTGDSSQAAIAQLVSQKGSAGFALTAQGIRPVKSTYTGVWLTGKSVKPVLIAAVTNDQIKKGRFTGLTRVPKTLQSYNRMLLTREAITKSQKAPAAPSSTVIVAGTLKVPADFSS